MKNENLAERLYNDLVNAGIEIGDPDIDTVNGHKIGDGPNMKQLLIVGHGSKYDFQYGPAFQFGFPASTLDEAYSKLLSEVISLGKCVRFYSLYKPKSVNDADTQDYEKITSRYLKDYSVAIDDEIERWDIMVGTAE